MYLFAILAAVISALTGEQAALIVFLATAIVQIINIVWVGLLKRPKPSIGSIRWVLFGTSLVLVYYWSPIQLPTTEDPMAFAVVLIGIALEIFVFAQIVYDKLLELVLGGLDRLVLTPIVATITGDKEATVSFLRPSRKLPSGG